MNTPTNPLGENVVSEKEVDLLKQNVLANSEKFEENEIRSDILPKTSQPQAASQNPVQTQAIESEGKDDTGAQKQSLVFAESPLDPIKEVENMVDSREPKDIKELEGLQDRANRAQKSVSEQK